MPESIDDNADRELAKPRLPRTYNPITLLRRATVDFVIRLLTKPARSYVLHVPNDLANLKKYIRKGDVILVEGNERISECIKYLTQSSWSHSVLYVGDEPMKRHPKRKAPSSSRSTVRMPISWWSRRWWNRASY